MRETKTVRMTSSDLEEERCTYILPNGDYCPYKKDNETHRCQQHQNIHYSMLKTQKIRKYRIGQLQRRYEELANDSHIKDLRDEIGICRLTLEEILKKAVSEGEDVATGIFTYSDVILKIVHRIESLVVSCQKIEERRNMLLSLEQVLSLASRFAEIIQDHPSLSEGDKENIVITIEKSIMEMQNEQDTETVLAGNL